MKKLGEKGFTRYELVSVIIIIVVIVAISIPVWLSFVEHERQGVDGVEAERAEDVAIIEFMSNHYNSGETIVYMFTGDSEVLKVYRHWSLGETEFPEIKTPRFDGYSDGGAYGGTQIRGKSKKVGDTPLYVVVTGDGSVVYNSWRELNLR